MLIIPQHDLKTLPDGNVRKLLTMHNKV